MDRAAYVTLHREASKLVGREPDIVAFSWRQPAQDSGVEVVNNLETVRLHRIVIDDMDDNVLSERDVHDRPWSLMIVTSIEPHVHAFVRHHDGENRRVGGACWTCPATLCLRTKDMKRVSSNEKTCHNYHDDHPRQRDSSGP